MRWEIRWAGFGGQGVIKAGEIIGKAAIKQGFECVMRPMYGPEKTGGWSKADVIISDEPIAFPLVIKPDILVAMSQDGMDREGPNLKRNGLLLIDGSLVREIRCLPGKAYTVEATYLAESLGARIVTNIIMLGAFSKIFDLLDENMIRQAIKETFSRNVEINMAAFELGRQKVEELKR